MFRQSDKPLEEKEFPDEADLIDDDDPPITLQRCPACGELVYGQTQQCSHCKEWIFLDSQDWRSSPKWYVRGGLYITRTLLLNWFFWIGVAVIFSIITLLNIFGLPNPFGQLSELP